MRQLVRLGDVAQINPRFDKSSLADDTAVSFVQMASVGAADEKINVSITRPFVEVKKGSYTPFIDGDVLFAKVTPCMENGKMAVARGLTNGVGFGSSEFHVLRPSDQVDAKYLYFFVSSQTFRKEAAGQMTGAVGLRRVPAAYLAEAQLPLFDLQEQRRIVAEIETQFSRLDEAVANLQRVKANLKRYKASVLKAAVEGRLVETEASIAQREGRSYETGEQLLQRILEVRRAKWTGKGKYEEPVSTNIQDLGELPDGWIWASAEQACERVVDCHNKTAPYTSTGIPLVRTTNIKDGRLLLDDTRYVDESTYEFWSRRCPPEPGDVLFTREAPMGEAGIIPPGVKLCLGQRTMLMRPSPAIAGSFLLSALLSPVVKDLIDRVAVGSGVKHLRVGDVEQLPVPLPPWREQFRIIAEVDRHISIIREVESTVDANLQRAQTLRQTTLAKCFSGESHGVSN